MTVIGTVRNGKIELPEGVTLPEGAEVNIEVARQLPKQIRGENSWNWPDHVTDCRRTYLSI